VLLFLCTSTTNHNSRRGLFLPYMPQVFLFFLSGSSKSQWPPELVVVIGRISYAKGLRDSILGFRVFEVLVESFDSKVPSSISVRKDATLHTQCMKTMWSIAILRNRFGSIPSHVPTATLPGLRPL